MPQGVPQGYNLRPNLFPPILTIFLQYFSNQLYFQKAGVLIRWDSILRPFETEIWLAIILWLIIVSVSLTIIFHYGKKYNLECKRGEVSFTFGNSALTSLRALCQQGIYLFNYSSYSQFHAGAT